MALMPIVGRQTAVSVGEQDTSSDGGEHELTRKTLGHTSLVLR